MRRCGTGHDADVERADVGAVSGSSVDMVAMGHDELAIENEQLKERIRRLERQVEAAPGTALRAPKLRAKPFDRR